MVLSATVQWGSCPDVDPGRKLPLWRASDVESCQSTSKRVAPCCHVLNRRPSMARISPAVTGIRRLMSTWYVARLTWVRAANSRLFCRAYRAARAARRRDVEREDSEEKGEGRGRKSCWPAGAQPARIRTVDFGRITSVMRGSSGRRVHPRFNKATLASLAALMITFPRVQDFALTYSSLELSGLGQYGDALNPWGDMKAARHPDLWMTGGQAQLVPAQAGWDLFLGLDLQGYRLRPGRARLERAPAIRPSAFGINVYWSCDHIV